MPPYDPRGTGLFPEPTPWNGDPEDEGDIWPEEEDPTDFECEDCIGMREHGCYCKAMGASAPGGPANDT